MNKEFVPYELALRLKSLCFDEPCFGYYENQDENLVINFNNLPLTENQKKRPGLYITDNRNSVLPQWATSAPTFSQAFKWFREKYGWIGSVWQCGISEEAITSFEYAIDRLNDLGVSQYRQNFPYKTYEEAELDCLEGLIEIIEQEKK